MNPLDGSTSRTRRVGDSAPANLFQRRSKRRVTAPILAVLAVVVIVPAAWSAADGEPDAARPASPAENAASHATGAEVRRPAAVDAAGRPAAEPVGAPFATFEDVTLRLPAESVLLVGYHEASFPDAVALEPIGDALANDNRTKFLPANETPDGPEYVVLSSRGRPQPATSAVDIVLEDRTEVLAPVTGEIVKVEPYLLYGEHEDTRVELVPDARPDLTLVMIHVEGVHVAAGDHVEAGVTPIADGPNRFPFGSQIDRFFDPDRWPHVHIELKRG